MKVLFLDVDGVLNDAKTNTRCAGFFGLEPKLVKRFLAWLPKDVKIVLSSTWRLYSAVHHCLNDAGITWIDVTDDLMLWDRGEEIYRWLKTHPEVTSFAILDDRDDFGGRFAEQIVYTNEKVGVTKADLAKVSAILEQP